MTIERTWKDAARHWWRGITDERKASHGLRVQVDSLARGVRRREKALDEMREILKRRNAEIDRLRGEVVALGREMTAARFAVPGAGAFAVPLRESIETLVRERVAATRELEKARAEFEGEKKAVGGPWTARAKMRDAERERDAWQARAIRAEAATLDGYQCAAKRTCPASAGYVMPALGLAGEAGEYADEIKKVVFHGKPVDEKRLAKELGDVLWYVAIAADSIGMKLSEVAAMNVEKLRARYPNGFSAEASAARVDEVAK
jgi:NTP pyrophosphatase (non-canonical NTP hydrolase)